ncbi:MAG: orotidine-5'-phosphate decarboxylase [Candidatus Lokiarchaeota archaeon]|nr:orotidine-5'-phosphate decarboxylase [Candidatus Lokiarchaeota archaeon]
MNFIEDVIQSIIDKRSVVCMGLDPRLDKEGEIPKFLINELEAPNKIILEFNKTLIDNTYDLIPVIKPQIAFYEKYEALNALKETIKYAHKKDLLVILDSKRNDIGATSEAYAYSTFKVFNADACTLNAYLGIDGIKPFLQYKNKGKFVLVKTSNPSSKDFQNIFSVEIPDISDSKIEINVENITLERNYIKMARLVQDWGSQLEQFSGFHNLGVVVGATFPEEIISIRNIVKNSFILLPGFGAQGATANDIKNGFNQNGLGGIVNSSRGIIYAYSKKDDYSPSKFGEAAREEISEMNQKINDKINL